MSCFDTCSRVTVAHLHGQLAAVTDATSYQLKETHPQDGVAIVYSGGSTS